MLWKQRVKPRRKAHHNEVLSVITVALVSLLPSSAQSPLGTGKTAQPYVIHQRVEEVLLYCSVVDHRGEIVTDLDRSAFTVFENQKNVPITYFANKDVPVSLSIVLDDSGSMKTKRTAVQDAALHLIKASNPDDETSVTNFAEKAYLDQDLTENLTRLSEALGQSKTVSGGTALFDTLIGAADHLATHAHRNKQVIVVVTDGDDNASEADLAAAIHRVQRTDGPIIYAIGLLYDAPSAQEKRARKELISLAEETGGIAFFPRTVDDVDRIAGEVARDIRSQYTVAFKPGPNTPNGSYHSITVKAAMTGKHGLMVRTRKGYLRNVATSIDK